MNFTETSLQNLINKAAELGYLLSVDENGEVEYLFPADRHNYTPEIFKGENGERNVMTVGYGTLPMEEIRKVIDGFYRAEQVITLLKVYGI